MGGFKFVKLKPKTEAYRRLLKNGYPRPYLGEQQGSYPVCVFGDQSAEYESSTVGVATI